jgi:hypothetical protein
MPTSRILQETGQDRIRLKNFRGDAFKRLMQDHGLRRPAAESMLLPMDELLEDETFWPYLSDGLSVFLAPDMHAVFRIALPLDPRMRIGDRFIVKPLVPILSGESTYYVLAISANAVRVFEGTRQRASEIRVSELPENMTHALTMRGREGDRAPNKQWQGDEGQKTLYRKYFLQIDRVLRPLYGSRSEPLVIAGVEYLLPIFREACSYRNIVAEGIAGNPDELSEEDIHTRAWPLVEPILDAPRREALERLATPRSTERVTEDISTILNAAYDGRVDTLFLNLELDLFGTFDPQTRETVVRTGEKDPGDLDLGGQAARWAHRCGGNVFSATADEIGGDYAAVAVLRY